MTEKPSVKRAPLWSAVLGCGILLLAIGMSAPLSEGVRHGLALCAQAVIPSVYPSMILSDLLLASRTWIERSVIGRVFARVFHLPPAAATAYLLGLCTGFPIGMRVCTELYREDVLTREQAEQLMAFSNNTGPAFLIAGVGVGLYADARIGIALYLCQVLASATVGITLGLRRRQQDDGRAAPPPPAFSLVESVRSAAHACVALCGFVSLFSAIAHLLTYLIPSPTARMLLLPLLEVSTAASYLGAHGAGSAFALCCTAFAVGFSGLSVHMQSMVFLSKTDINPRQYYISKVVQGLLCATLVLPILACLGV